MINKIKKQFKGLIGSDKIEDCIEKLEKEIDDRSHLKNKVFIALGRISSLKRKAIQNVISHEIEEIERNQIRLFVLSIIDELTEKDLINYHSLEKEPYKLNSEGSDYPFYALKGFQAGTFIDIMQEAIRLINNARELKVIGSARQDMMAISDVPLMEKYLSAIEGKLIHELPQEVFQYRRISTQNIKAKFKDHLINCFEISNKTKNITEVVLEQDIDLTITYFIIDDKMVVLNLYTTISLGMKDNTLLLKSFDKEIIQQFSQHFEEAWLKAKTNELVIDSFKRFNQVIPVNESVYKKIDKIRSCLRSIPNNSIRMDHAHREIEQTCSRLIGLKEYNLNIEHKLTNGKLLSVFYRYINELDNTGSYQVLSFYEFWNNLSDIDTFIMAHENALVKGAKILRIYVLDDTLTKSKIFYQKQRNIIRKNISLSKKYKNYDFRMLFSNNYSELLTLYENFGIWTQGNEKIVFFPEHQSPEYPIGKTSLYFINDNYPQHNNYSRNKARYDRAMNILTSRLQEQETQKRNLRSDQKKFLQKFGI